MTDTTTTGTGSGRVPLRTLLLIDAATCVATGSVAIAAAGPIADLLGLDSHAWVRGVGVFLVAYSAALWSLARANPVTARRGALVTTAGDGVWVVATVALVIAGAFSGAGIAVVGAVGLAVAALGAAKAEAVRPSPTRAGTASPRR